MGQLKVRFSFPSIILMDTRVIQLTFDTNLANVSALRLEGFSTQRITLGLVIYKDHRKTPPKAPDGTKFDCDNN